MTFLFPLLHAASNSLSAAPVFFVFLIDMRRGMYRVLVLAGASPVRLLSK